MRFPRGINSVFQRLFVSVIVFFMLAATPTLAQTPQSATPCGVSHKQHLFPIFQNLKGANFYIAFPNDLRDALKCRDHEKECAERAATQAGSAIPADQKERYIQDRVRILKEHNTAFPEDLYPEPLTDRFLLMTKQMLSPVLPRDNSCQAFEPTMINPDSTPAAYAATEGAEGILNLRITVVLVSRTNPHVVVLIASESRLGNEYDFHPSPIVTAIPLNMSADDTKSAFADFTQRVRWGFQPQAAAEQ